MACKGIALIQPRLDVRAGEAVVALLLPVLLDTVVAAVTALGVVAVDNFVSAWLLLWLGTPTAVG